MRGSERYDYGHGCAQSAEQEVGLSDAAMEREVIFARGQIQIEPAQKEHPCAAAHMRKRESEVAPVRVLVRK